MDYHYVDSNTGSNNIPIIDADYWTLVNLLTTQITPQIRKQILSRLTDLNDQLILANAIQNQFHNGQNSQDLSRSTVHPTTNCRKKDVTELQHPSLDMFNYNGNNQYNTNIIGGHTNNNFLRNQDQSDIDLDEILADIHDSHDNHESHPDALDQELARIKNLYGKVIASKRRRRRERQ